jgi:dTDP-4-dehydrorhamnose 3,5-epimerase
MPFEFIRMDIPEVILIKPKSFKDDRGFFVETYKATDFHKNGITDNFVQDNHSKSTKGVLRGLHYQKLPQPQAKLVRCISGEILDIAVDIRKGSPNYSKWVGIKLSEDNQEMLYVPVGFAHAFIVLSETAEVLYKTSNEYSPPDEAGIIWNDPQIGVDWKISEVLVSEKDKKLPKLAEANNNFVYRELI